MTPDPAVSAVARLVLVHLREGVGFGVDWREFPDETALRGAVSAGKIDLAVGLPEGAVRSVHSAAGTACPSGALEEVRDHLRRSWGAEAFLLGFSAGPDDCARPALVVARAVLEDLRFGILRKEAARVAQLITAADVAAVRAAAERGGERAALSAARAALAAKGRR